MAYEQERRRYGTMYGPTVGDRIRLADTDLIIEVERNLIPYGDEINAGVAKTARDSMGASSTAPRDSCLDVVISNVVVLDPVLGILKADIGIKDGRVAGIGNAGNPDTMSGLDMVVGTTTSIISTAGLIATPGGLDVHVHYLSPGLVPVALASGLTTMVGGGVGLMFDVGVNPQHHIDTMIRAFEAFPINVGFLGRGSSSTPSHPEYTIACGACGLKMHEDMGISPAVIDCCLRVADQYDVQAFIHTDSLNESGHFEETMAAIAGRTVHAYHCEGAGGGHEPGKLADVVLWRPKFFGVKPELVIKGGVPVLGATGSADASIRYAEPVYLRPLWGAVGAAPARLSLLFTSQLAYEQNLAQRVPTTRRVVPVRGTRVLRKQHMVRNAALPMVKVNPETYDVIVDGQRAWCDPVDQVPMNQ